MISTRWAGAALAGAVLLSYANALTGPFILDDQASVVQNPQIRSLTNLRDVLVPAQDSPVAGRPLVNLSFALNYAAGGLDVRGYHVVNIALHVVCALLACAVARRTVPAAVAFVGTVLWAVHPLNTEVVNYVSQRTESMMAAFYLLTLYAAVRGWTTTAVVACALGALCKESIATAPLVVALYDRIFLFDSWKAALVRRKYLYAGLAATWVLVAVMVSTGARAAVAGFSSGVSPWTYLLNQAVMITEYLRLSVWPDRLVAFYGWPLPVTVADVAPKLAFITLLVGATAVALVRVPPLGFLGAWFFITLAPASSVIPVATEVGAERRMYLPLLAVTMLVAAAVVRLKPATLVRLKPDATVVGYVVSVLGYVVSVVGYVVSGFSRTISVAVVLAIVAALGATTLARNREYQSALRLAQTIVERRQTAVAYHMLAEQQLAAKQTADAIRNYRQAVSLGNTRAAYALGLALYNEGRYDEAIESLETFIRTAGVRLTPRWLEPVTGELVIARVAIGRSHLAQRRWGAAAEQAARALELGPGHPPALLLMADATFAEQRWPQSADSYRQYLQRQPSDVGALINYGITQVAAQNMDEAVAAFARATELDPANARARELLALAREDRARLTGR